MARFLITTAPAAGHVNPIAPLARKLVARGHEVGWCTSRFYQNKVEATGATFFPIDPSIDPLEQEIYDFFPGLKERKGLPQIKWYMKLFLDWVALHFQMLDAVLREFPADVLITDTVGYGTVFFSEKHRKPCAMVQLLPLGIPSRDAAPFGTGLLPGGNGFSRMRNIALNAFMYGLVFRDIDKHTNMVRQHVGLPPLQGPLFRAYWRLPDLLLQITTPAFEYPRSDLPSHVRFIGPMLPAVSDGFVPPSWWPELTSGRRVVLVTQGTIAKDVTGLILPTIEALAHEDVLVVAVPLKPANAPRLPRNVRAEPFVPFDLLMPHVDVMVTNGGYGGVHFALAHGVPLVVAGETEDKAEVAGRVEWCGAGINLRRQSPSAPRIKKAVLEVLGTPSYKQNAQKVQADFAKYDAPLAAAELLENLASTERQGD